MSTYGEFTKCVNNTESVFCERKIGEKPEAFIHFRWERSGKNFRLLGFKENRLPSVWSRICGYKSLG